MVIDLPGEPITAELTDEAEGGEEAMETMEQEQEEAEPPVEPRPESGSESECKYSPQLI